MGKHEAEHGVFTKDAYYYDRHDSEQEENEQEENDVTTSFVMNHAAARSKPTQFEIEGVKNKDSSSSVSSSSTVVGSCRSICGKGCDALDRIPFLVFRILPYIICVAYIVFIGFAVCYDPVGAVFPCVVAVFVLYVTINRLSRRKVSRTIGKAWRKVRKSLIIGKAAKLWIRRILTVVCCIGILVYLVIDIWDAFDKWIGVGGLMVFILISILFSKHRTKIDYTPVIWGVILQFAIGLLLLRWPMGNAAFQRTGVLVTDLLAHTDKGSKFVFGEKYTDHPVVFKILPVVVFFSGLVSVLYYLGVMQGIIKAVAIVLEVAMATTPIESFSTATHIFIGQVESSLALKPFFKNLTDSELHAVMTGGFATVAGTVVAAYAEFGVPAEHVIAASFMSAPAALAIAKISLPETCLSSISSRDDIKVEVGKESNLIEALSNGATVAIKLVSYVVVNLIAFVATLSLLDSVIIYLGSCVGHPEVNFQFLCSYAFMPLAVLMGIPWGDARLVGALIGKKILLNEFLAYADLGVMISEGTLTGRTAAITTYILCGFGSVAAMGINLGALTSAEPSKRQEFAKLILRAMLNGNIACFMTACIAGVLYQDVSVSQTGFPANITEIAPLLNGTLAS